MESIENLIWEFENGSISAYKLIEKLKEINDNINNQINNKDMIRENNTPTQLKRLWKESI